MKNNRIFFPTAYTISLLLFLLLGYSPAGAETPSDYTALPVIASTSEPPLVMLVMGRDHKLYYEAYNDASDLDDDGELDIHYNPDIEYYGYFDSYKYYSYSSSNGRFEPQGVTGDFTNQGTNYWSGNFLNYLTMSRMDTVRKVLYGGYRSTDTETETVLERAYITDDAHCWGKEYTDAGTDGYDISDYTPYSLPSFGKRHLFVTGSMVAPDASGYAPLLRVKLDSGDRIWDWASAVSGEIMGDSVVGTPDYDYKVRVLVGVSTMPEENCKKYPSGYYKPTGLLQRYGETDRMYFGLLTGSNGNHLSGGVLRKNISSFSDEVDSTTGRFTYITDTTFDGIVKTIDNLRLSGFDHSNNVWDATWYHDPLGSTALPEGNNYMWGNPVSEMMYETLRYFSGVKATSDFSDQVSDGDDEGLDLPLETWVDPYGTYPYCSKPIMLVISDINPSYDTDQLPGVYSGFDESFSGTLGTLDVEDELDDISLVEGASGNHFIGVSGTDSDSACSSKSVSSLGDIRGICPEEPTKEGGYYAAAVAYYGRRTDLRDSLEEDQKVSSYIVGLSSPLPNIEIEMDDGHVVTLVPFAKSISGTWAGGININGDFQPTCSWVDFYVEELGTDSGTFRLVYEHAEQGSDFDMDAIITYKYEKQSDGTLDISMEASDSCGGSTKQHFGYIISGTTEDGVYLEIKYHDDCQSDSADMSYPLDTPPNSSWSSSAPYLPTSTTRTFTPSNTSAATLLESPLYYAAKYGGFKETGSTANDIPDEQKEWDADSDGVPDNYFLVTNPTVLEEKLSKAFASMYSSSASGTSASVLATTNEGDGTVLQAHFRPEVSTLYEDYTWFGYLQSLWVDSKGNIREDSDHDYKLDVSKDDVIVYEVEDGETVVHRFDVSSDSYPDTDGTNYGVISMEDVEAIWEAGSILSETLPSERNIYTYPLGGGANMASFDTSTNFSTLKYYLGVGDVDVTAFPSANITLLGSTLDTRAATLIDYVRGVDATGLRDRTIDSSSNTVWKLGDIVYSTAISISGAVEEYHSIYSDSSYGDYVTAQKNRQTMVYVGANDGMLHAFSAGCYNETTQKFDPAAASGQGSTIGDELWAYIPKAVLPHLKWLADPDYDHTYYVDLTPKIFDAEIDRDGDSKPEWGTFLLLGLNMGGKDIQVDTTGDNSWDTTIKPTYTLIDITDPANPNWMWERSYDGLGMSRSIPAIMKVAGDYWDENDILQSGTDGKWMAVFGSGPHGTSAYEGYSDQAGRVYVIDLETGAPYTDTSGNDYLFTTSDYAVVNSPITLDKGLTYEVNTVYFGESILSGTSEIGKVWSFDTYDKTDTDFSLNAPLYWSVDDTPANWSLHLLLEELPSGGTIGPVMATMNLTTDKNDEIWIYFGTGRYIASSDKSTSDQQYLFGLKDPLFNASRGYDSAEYTISATSQTVDFSISTGGGLLESNNYRVYTDQTVEGYDGSSWNSFGDFSDLLALIRQSDSSDTDWLDGWVRELESTSPSERCISEFSLLGGAVYVPAYTPSDTKCEILGTSNLYGLYYETGTGYYNPLLGAGNNGLTNETISLGEGAPPTSTGIHVGEDEEAFLQMSTGQIIQTDVNAAFSYKSRITNWYE